MTATVQKLNQLISAGEFMYSDPQNTFVVQMLREYEKAMIGYEDSDVDRSIDDWQMGFGVLTFSSAYWGAKDADEHTPESLAPVFAQAHRVGAQIAEQNEYATDAIHLGCRAGVAVAMHRLVEEGLMTKEQFLETHVAYMLLRDEQK